MLLWTLLYTVHYLTLEEEIEELKSWNPKNSQTLTDSTLLWLSVFSQGGRFAYFNQQGLDDGVFLSTFRDHWYLIPTTHLRIESLCTHSEIHISLQEKKKSQVEMSTFPLPPCYQAQNLQGFASD